MDLTGRTILITGGSAGIGLAFAKSFVELDINVAGPIRTVSVLVERLIANRGTIVNVSSGLAFVPLQAGPIYCATKAALHSDTLSLRQQLEGKVHVVELMPPAVHTDLTADLPKDGDFAILTTEQLLAETIPALRKGTTEIRPGQANQLHWMSRIAPGFINGQLTKGSVDLIPEA
ncbi:MAG: SDR family NAD(P)-dependent oxidoreductase [Proteobacteria bacterium]|nr:SDR family NAD(P)-dependent oxidoreductase [Pseudomonadota bacterium]MCP4921064.1 SDR family NAD(P)-dependent oxidoreductase [Pseudomonadota bacterium]